MHSRKLRTIKKVEICREKSIKRLDFEKFKKNLDLMELQYADAFISNLFYRKQPTTKFHKIVFFLFSLLLSMGSVGANDTLSHS